MKYFFVLGNNPALSLAEIAAIFNFDQNYLILGENNVLLAEIEQDLDAKLLIKRLGGTIKIGKIIASTELTQANILSSIKENIELSDKKFNYGFSNYIKGFNIKPLAMEIKKFIKDKGKNCRWVISKDPILSSVVVEQNNLTDGGAEFVLLSNKKTAYIGKTISVQPFKELSFRDYGRPSRDDFSGMLPPKLAQIMLNLAIPSTASLFKKDCVLLDPFCGSGTVLTEAALMGLKNLIGSDISGKAIDDTEKNIEWTINNYQLRIKNYDIFLKSATELSKVIEENSVDAIVTEPYLGPQRGFNDIRTVVKELEDLYAKSIREFKKVLKPGSRAVMVWPVFRSKSAGNIMLRKNIADDMKIISPLPSSIAKEYKLSNRNTIIYGRSDQKVWREVIILEK